MLEKHVYPVILAGGSGTRLWPVSRKHFPKQFQSFYNANSLLHNTITRFTHLQNNPLIICHNEHRFLVKDLLEEMKIKTSIILEPVSKNTAPAIALGAQHALKHDPDAIILVVPSDHWLSNPVHFSELSKKAFSLAAGGAIVLFGVQPTHPETEYGYIEIGEAIENYALSYKMEQFVEKPSKEKAIDYLAAGTFLWNSGMFCMRADVYLKSLSQSQPAVYECSKKAYELAQCDDDFIWINEDAYQNTPSISIDYGVMENITANHVPTVVISSDLKWSDLGSWTAFWQLSEKDAHNNAVQGDVFLKNSHHCFVRADTHMVAMIGMQNCLVIDTKDALLIVDKEHVHHLKEMVGHFDQSTREEVAQHTTVQRPWGTYETIDRAERYKVKRITVKPGGRLSLQMHHHRAEHWIVVKGTAKVIRGDEELYLQENQSTYIPHGAVHRLENPGIIPLELIEVQSGSYLGEDDIVRFEDAYCR